MFRIIILLSTLFASALFAASDTLTMAISNWEPYKGDNLLNKGVTTEITKTALEKAGYSVKVVSLPWKRALHEVSDGRYHILPAIWSTPEREKKLLFTEPILASRVVVVSRKESAHNVNKLKDLSGLTIGVGRGWGYPKEFLEDTNFTKQPVSDLTLNVKKLIFGRVDAIVGEVYAVRYTLLKHFPEHESKLHYSTWSIQEKPLRVAITREHVNHKVITKRFNNALKEMEHDGTLEDIISKHGLLGTTLE